MLGSKRIVSSTACGSRSGSDGEQRRLVGMAQQRQERAAELAPGGVVAADDQVADHRAHFVVREPLAVDLGDQRARSRDRRPATRAAARAARRRTRSASPTPTVAASICSGDANPNTTLSASAHPTNRSTSASGTPISRQMTRSGSVGDAATRSPPPRSRTGAYASSAISAAATRIACDRPRRERLLHERAQPAVHGAFVGEHERAVPIAQRPVGDADHVEVAEPDAVHARVAAERVDVGVAQHDHHAGLGIARERAGERGVAQHRRGDRRRTRS